MSLMKKFLLWFVPGLVAGVLLILGAGKAVTRTSSNEYCMSCHIHPEADAAWKKSTHFDTQSGFRTACVDCHLPPKGHGYMWAKAKTGLRDLWSYWTKDSAKFNWADRRRLETARAYTYESSCIKCHENLFPSKLTKAGEDAHLYYQQTKKTDELHCINCHLNAGHFIAGYTHGSNSTFGASSSAPKEVFTEPVKVEKFESFREKIPRSSVSFNMIAIPAGKFKMGSPDTEPFRKPDEGPVREVEVSPFFMAEIEVSWDEYLAFYIQTAAEGRSTDTEGIRSAANSSKTDAISGATPPYGQPDQGWGLGKRPAISFSYHAAETYCKWLSQVTGKTYRLPTEAEWEYACRAGSQAPYPFPGNPKKFEKKGFLAKISGNDTAVINSYVIYKDNSSAKTQLPDRVKPNAFGLRNMAGNVAEFCSDWYQPDTYQKYPDGIKDPKGPEEGTEHVVRGGSYLSSAGFVRSAARDYTRTEEWLKTDPQMPKSIWWYSDCFNAGFRVVCEFDSKTGNSGSGI